MLFDVRSLCAWLFMTYFSHFERKLLHSQHDLRYCHWNVNDLQLWTWYKTSLLKRAEERTHEDKGGEGEKKSKVKKKKIPITKTLVIKIGVCVYVFVLKGNKIWLDACTSHVFHDMPIHIHFDRTFVRLFFSQHLFTYLFIPCCFFCVCCVVFFAPL